MHLHSLFCYQIHLFRAQQHPLLPPLPALLPGHPVEIHRAAVGQHSGDILGLLLDLPALALRLVSPVHNVSVLNDFPVSITGPASA